MNARQINFFDLAAFELRLDELGEMPRAGEDDETAGVGVESVHGSGSIARNRSSAGRGSHNLKKIGLRSHQFYCQFVASKTCVKGQKRAISEYPRNTCDSSLKLLSNRVVGRTGFEPVKA